MLPNILYGLPIITWETIYFIPVLVRNDVNKCVDLYDVVCTLLKKENLGINSKYQCSKVISFTHPWSKNTHASLSN